MVGDAISIVGLDKAGKTVIGHYLASGIIFEETRPTLSVNYSQMILSEVQFMLMDCPGQIKFRNKWKTALDKSKFIIYVVDTADKKRFYESDTELKNILSNPDYAQIPLIILFHKMDMSDAKKNLSEAKTIFNQDAIQEYGARKLVFMETSMLNTTSLDDVKFYIEKEILGAVSAEIAKDADNSA
jgi:small GTP-binding protein